MSDWRIENGVLHASVTAPPDATATLYLPSAAPEAVTEGGRPAAQSRGVKFTGSEKGTAIFELASGHYEFASKSGRRGERLRPATRASVRFHTYLSTIKARRRVPGPL